MCTSCFVTHSPSANEHYKSEYERKCTVPEFTVRALIYSTGARSFEHYPRQALEESHIICGCLSFIQAIAILYTLRKSCRTHKIVVVPIAGLRIWEIIFNNITCVVEVVVLHFAASADTNFSITIQHRSNQCRSNQCRLTEQTR